MNPNNLEIALSDAESVNGSSRSGEANNFRSLPNSNTTMTSLTNPSLSRYHHRIERIWARTGTDKTGCLREHWRPSEDAKLKELVGQIGPHKWSLISEHLPCRSAKSCRKRWFHHLDPTINKQPFTEQEEIRLIAAQRVYGNKWATIARLFHGRTDNAIRNHWHVIMYRWARERQQEMVSFSGHYSHGGSAFSTRTTELSLTPPSATVTVAQPRFLNFSNTLAPGYNGQYVHRAEVGGLNGQKMDHQIHHKVEVSEGKVELKKVKNGFYFYDFLNEPSDGGPQKSSS